MLDKHPDHSADLLHGGNLASVQALYPDAPRPWLDLSTGINPWPFAYTRLSADAFEKLPTAALQQRANAAAASAFGCQPQQVVLTPGSQAAIQLMPLLRPARRVAIVTPTYSEHALSWRHSGAEVVEIASLPDAHDGFDAVIVVNPNNPDGRVHSHRDLKQLAASLASKSGHLVIDEAFADVDPAISLAHEPDLENTALLRSFGKFYGLAGIRLGAIIASPELITAAQAQLGPWSISGPALEIGAQAYADTQWQTSMRVRLAQAATALDTSLASTGITVTGGTSLFRWITTADAHHTWRALVARGIYTRRFPWSSTHLRIGIPASDAEQQRLIEALCAA